MQVAFVYNGIKHFDEVLYEKGVDGLLSASGENENQKL